MEKIVDDKNASQDALKKIVDLKTSVHAVFGQVVHALSSVPRYRSQSLADLGHLVVDPLAHDCIIVASLKATDELLDPAAVFTPAAVAIWARVSEPVEEKLKEQINAGSFPVRLKPEDWRSGEKVWLLDIIAPSRAIATDILRNFNQICKSEQVAIHPVIAGLVDQDVLTSMRARGDADVEGGVVGAEK